MDKISDKDRQDVVDKYQAFIGMFVVAECANGKKVIGILKEITADNKLSIHGKYMFWLIDPEEITYFSARPDRFKNGGGCDR